MEKSWWGEYCNLIEKGYIENAKELLLREIPADEIIYKYFRGINRDYNTITGSELWLCNAYALNDPYDCAFLANRYPKRCGNEDDYTAQYQLNVESKNMQNKVFVSCFSERSDSLLMWSHYANNHRGICVGYGLKELIEKYGCFPVIYSDVIPKWQENNNPHLAMLTKYKEWEYEKEWRIIKVDENSRGKIGIKEDFIKPQKIILGCKQQDFYLHATKMASDEKVEFELKEIDSGLLINYAKEELQSDCCQYELCSDSFTLRPIIRI